MRPEPPDRLDDDLTFFLDRSETNLENAPLRLHSSKRLSEDGSPAWTEAFVGYLDANPRSTVKAPGQPERYRWPCRAALDKLAYHDPGTGRPRYDKVLYLIAACRGDIDKAAEGLAKNKNYPKMRDPKMARAHLAKSLRQFGKVYRVEPHRPTPAVDIAA